MATDEKRNTNYTYLSGREYANNQRQWVKDMTEINFENQIAILDTRVGELERALKIAEGELQELRRTFEAEKPKDKGHIRYGSFCED